MFYPVKYSGEIEHVCYVLILGSKVKKKLKNYVNSRLKKQNKSTLLRP